MDNLSEINYSAYQFDKEFVFGKQELKERLEKQLGDFGEQLVMTLLGRLSRFSVAYVDHEGADLIASDKEGHSYAISVKSYQIGPKESESKVFSFDNQEKLCAFAEDFHLIPAVALNVVSTDFAYVDVYLMTLSNFNKLAEQEESPAIRKVKGGLQINNYSLGTGNIQAYSDRKGYLSYLHTNDLIGHVRLDVRDRRCFKRGLQPDIQSSDDEKLDPKDNNLRRQFKDNNLRRQFGDFGEYFVMMLLGRLKHYKVARVDHVGADLIATDLKGKTYAISVKTNQMETYSFEENYTTGKIPKHELGKLADFAEKYPKMIPAVACVFIDKDFKGIDIYIATLETWLSIGCSGESEAVQCTDKCTFLPLTQTKDWRRDLGKLTINASNNASNPAKKNQKKDQLNNDDRIEHMHLTFDSLFCPEKDW